MTTMVTTALLALLAVLDATELDTEVGVRVGGALPRHECRRAVRNIEVTARTVE